MTIDLEDRLYRELGGLAERADHSGLPLLELHTVTERVDQRRHRRTAARVTGLGACALLVVGGLLAVRSGRSGAPTAPPAGGVEEPLTELAAAGLGMPGVAKPGTSVRVQLADGQVVAFGDVAMTNGAGYGEGSCVSVSVRSPGSVCSPGDWTASEHDLGGTSTLVYWAHLPAAATRVEYRSDGRVRWQRPVRGVAAFTASAPSPNDTFVAYDGSGRELDRVSWSGTSMATGIITDADGTETVYLYLPKRSGQTDGVLPTMDDRQQAAFYVYADDTMRACLAAGGDAAWTSCLQSTDAAAKAYAQTVRDQTEATTSTTTG